MGKPNQIIIDPMKSPLEAAMSSNTSKNNNDANNLSSDNPMPESNQAQPTRNIEREATDEAIKEHLKEEIKAEEGPSVTEQASQEAAKDALRETKKEKKLAVEKLKELSNTSGSVLCRIKNIIPILTSEVVVDTTKVTFIHRPFFLSERIHTVSIKNILDVYIETAPFFATLNLVDAGFVENVVRVSWLWKKDAEKARRIITGLREASKENIDLKKIGGNMAQELEQIGKVREINTTVSKG